MPHLTRRKNEGNNPGKKHLELSERRRAFARKKRSGKRVVRKAGRIKHKAAKTRSRLDELMFGTFNVRTAAVNGVNGIGHIDTLLRPCAAKGCDGIGLQVTKRDGTSEIVASGYHVLFLQRWWQRDQRQKRATWGWTGDKGEIVKNAGMDGIAIECISRRLMKAQISIKSNFVTFVVANVPTEEAPEGQKTISTWPPSTAP